MTLVPMYKGYSVNVSKRGPTPLPGEMLYTKIQLQGIEMEELIDRERLNIEKLWKSNWKKLQALERDDNDLAQFATENRIAFENAQKRKAEEEKWNLMLQQELSRHVVPTLTQSIPHILQTLLAPYLQMNTGLVQPPPAGVGPTNIQAQAPLPPPPATCNPMAPPPTHVSPPFPPQTNLVGPYNQPQPGPSPDNDCIYAPPVNPNSRIHGGMVNPITITGRPHKRPRHPSLSSEPECPVSPSSSTTSLSLFNPTLDPDSQGSLLELMASQPLPEMEPLLPPRQGGNIDLAQFPSESPPQNPDEPEENEDWHPNKRQRTE